MEFKLIDKILISCLSGFPYTFSMWKLFHQNFPFNFFPKHLFTTINALENDDDDQTEYSFFPESTLSRKKDLNEILDELRAPSDTLDMSKQNYLLKPPEQLPTIDKLFWPIDNIMELEEQDGVKLSLTSYLSTHCLATASTHYQNASPFSFNLLATLFPRSRQDKTCFISALTDSGTGTLKVDSEIPAILNPNTDHPINLTFSANFPEGDVKKSKFDGELLLDQLNQEETYAIRLRNGNIEFEYVNQINQELSAGIQCVYSPSSRQSHSIYGFQYEKEKDNFYMKYEKSNHSEMPLTLGYLYKHSPALFFATKLKTGLKAPKSDLSLGFKMRFRGGEVKGNVSTSLKVNSSLTHVLYDYMLISIFGKYDFQKEENSKFGLSLNLGAF